MQRGRTNSDTRQYQSDGRLARQPVSDGAMPETGEVDALLLAMRQLMQLPGQASG
jgi:hypothetical protein